MTVHDLKNETLFTRGFLLPECRKFKKYTRYEAKTDKQEHLAVPPINTEKPYQQQSW